MVIVHFTYRFVEAYYQGIIDKPPFDFGYFHDNRSYGLDTLPGSECYAHVWVGAE